MFHPSRYHKRSGSFRSTPLLGLLFVLALVAGLSAHPQDQASKQQLPDLKSAKPGESRPFSMTSAPAGVPFTLPAALASAGGEPRVARAQAGAADYYVIRAEFDSAASRARLALPGFTVLTAFDRFVDLFVPAKLDEAAWNAFQHAPGFRWWEPAKSIELPPVLRPQAAAPTRAVPEQIVRGGYAGLTGKGVIVAVIDSGIDFRNADFITYDAAGHPTSRLLYFWDSFSTAYASSGLGSKAPYSYPNGQSIGTLYSRQQLSAELASGSKRIPAPDEHGHGTAAAGIAAGNGNNSKGVYAGVAPDADIIGVRLGGPEGHIDNGYLLNAVVEWIDALAKREGKPVVFSCSFGGHSGGHDGSTIEERELNARFAANAPGRAIVIAAGNEQQSGIHSRQLFQGSDHPGLFAWGPQDPKDPKGSASIALLLRTQSGATPDFSKLGAAPIPDKQTGQPLMPTPRLNGKPRVHPISGDLILQFDGADGWTGFFLWNTTGEPIQADAYLYTQNYVAFYPEIQSKSEIVGTPGTTPAAITVGSYEWNDQFNSGGSAYTWKGASCGGAPMRIGDLSCYSSIGLSRAGVVKPEIIAPGEYYAAPYAKYLDGTGVRPLKHDVPERVESSGNYILFNGTSAATPYAAGIVALMMQKKPTITSSEIKSLFQRNATQDSYTGPVPNAKWGHGKLDLAAVRAVLNAIR